MMNLCSMNNFKELCGFKTQLLFITKNELVFGIIV